MTRKMLYTMLGILLSALLLLSACGPSSISNTLPQNQKPVPTVVLDNTAPANIDLSLAISISQLSPNQAAHLAMSAEFFYQKNAFIVFKRGEKLVCSGVTLPMDSQNAYETSNIPASGTVLNCAYSSPQGQTSFSITVPERPKIISPTSGATIVRSTQTPMVVSVTSTCKDLGIVLYYSNGGDGYTGAGLPSQAGCVVQQTVDTSQLSAGKGALGVNEDERITDPTINPGFHSFSIYINSGIVIPVTWQ